MLAIASQSSAETVLLIKTRTQLLVEIIDLCFKEYWNALEDFGRDREKEFGFVRKDVRGDFYGMSEKGMIENRISVVYSDCYSFYRLYDFVLVRNFTDYVVLASERFCF